MRILLTATGRRLAKLYLQSSQERLGQRNIRVVCQRQQMAKNISHQRAQGLLNFCLIKRSRLKCRQFVSSLESCIQLAVSLEERETTKNRRKVLVDGRDDVVHIVVDIL